MKLYNCSHIYPNQNNKRAQFTDDVCQKFKYRGNDYAAIPFLNLISLKHYNDVIMSTMASQITSLTIAYSTVYSSADQRNYQSSASLALVRGIHRWQGNSPQKGPVTRKMVPFDDVIMKISVRATIRQLSCHEQNLGSKFDLWWKILGGMDTKPLYTQSTHPTLHQNFKMTACCPSIIQLIQGPFCVCAQPMRHDVAS